MVDTRPLRESDREDILEIAKNTWDGHDHLPYFFDEWLANKDCHTLAIEDKGKVAALANLRIIENGLTGWMESLRVHPDYRGKGLASKITNYLVELAKDLNVQRIRYTTATLNEHSLHLAKKIGMTRKFDLGVYWEAEADKIQWEYQSSGVNQKESADIIEEISEAQLFPHDILISDWKAVDVTVEALITLQKKCEFWIEKNETSISSISIGEVRYDTEGPQWSFSVYPTNNDSFLNQLSYNIGLTKEKGYKRFMMTYPLNYKKILFEMEWVNQESKEFALTLLEKIL
ncbi:MAG: GNAT family N-acetyltransferase [Candidatus Thorarchaeota archaeon]|nr:GNAT family N-acetyltransferase [Candidatus Thorarchaeota archaeon]